MPPKWKCVRAYKLKVPNSTWNIGGCSQCSGLAGTAGIFEMEFT